MIATKGWRENNSKPFHAYLNAHNTHAHNLYLSLTHTYTHTLTHTHTYTDRRTLYSSRAWKQKKKQSIIYDNYDRWVLEFWQNPFSDSKILQTSFILGRV